jgi:hypothetical protein
VKWVNDLRRDQIDLKEFTVTDVDFFGPVDPKRLGFVKGYGLAFDKESGDPIPAIAFIRGGAVAVLIIVTVIDDEKISKKYVLLCKQLRFPAGCVLTEACAGMIDDQTRNVTGVVFNEVRQETGFVITEQSLIRLGSIIPSGGGCDEVVHLYAWETSITPSEFEEKKVNIYGEGAHEKIKLAFYEYETFDETLDEIMDCKAECCWRRYLKYKEKQDQEPQAKEFK